MTPDSKPSVSAHYEGDAGKRYVAHYQANPYLLGYELDFAYFKPHLQPHHVALDFGCGNGGILRLLANHVQKAEGLEVNQHAASIARSLGLTVHSTLNALPEAPHYDVVISNHVLEHVRDVPSTLERVRACLKPEGLLLLKLPIDDWRAWDERRWARDEINHHLQTWTPRLIGNCLYESGYEVENVAVITSAWHPRLFPLLRVGLGSLAFWALAVLKKRRQLFVVGRASP